MTPGFKIFYEKKCYGELFVYDYDEKMDLYRMAFPIIDNKSTFITSNIYFTHQKYKKTSLFPTKKTLFEDFYVRTPNNIKEILNTTYKGNLLECKYWTSNNIHELSNLYLYKLFSKIEYLFSNHFLFIYIFIHSLIKKFMDLY
jgi:hypothetical protein